MWPAPPPDALLALSIAPRRHERLAVQGLFRPDGSLEVASVLAREGEGRLGRLLMASASTCEGDGCLPLQITPLDGRDPWAEPWLDADQAPGDPTHRNLALARAHSPQGTLLTGIRRGRGAARHLEISDYFLEIPLTPTLCGDDLTRAIAQASAGLLWPSESDEPIAPFLAALDGEVPLDGPQLLALLQLPLSTPLETRAMAAFDFNGHSTPGMDAGELAQAARFRALRAALEANLSGVTSYYVGAVDVTVLVVGRSRCGELAGIRTTAVET